MARNVMCNMPKAEIYIKIDTRLLQESLKTLAKSIEETMEVFDAALETCGIIRDRLKEIDNEEIDVIQPTKSSDTEKMPSHPVEDSSKSK